MDRRPLAMTPDYLAFVHCVHELQRLACEGRDDSPEADAIRDAADGPWEALTEIERERACGLSEDLYSISEPPSGVPLAMNPQAKARLNNAHEAIERGDWDMALKLLRRWHKHVRSAEVSYLRGSIWLKAGDPTTASLFYEHATKLEPENGKYRVLVLISLAVADYSKVQRQAGLILEHYDKYPPAAVVAAAFFTFGSVLSMPETEARRLVPVLEYTLTRIKEVNDNRLNHLTSVAAMTFLGVCHELLNDRQAAAAFYSRGLKYEPNSIGLLVVRGRLLYGLNPQAIGDFSRAIHNRTTILLPYFLLAHHYLTSKQYEDCLGLCERASLMSASDVVKSELAEWSAICMAELGYAAETVQEIFAKSMRLDPSNSRAARNFAAFEEVGGAIGSKVWEVRPESEVRGDRDGEVAIRESQLLVSNWFGQHDFLFEGVNALSA